MRYKIKPRRSIVKNSASFDAYNRRLTELNKSVQKKGKIAKRFWWAYWTTVLDGKEIKGVKGYCLTERALIDSMDDMGKHRGEYYTVALPTMDGSEAKDYIRKLMSGRLSNIDTAIEHYRQQKLETQKGRLP